MEERLLVRAARVLAAACLAGSAASQAPVLPPGFELVEAGGPFDGPAGLAFAPDGRAFVIERGGRVVLHQVGGDQATPVLDIHGEVNDWGDRGLLGIALHPDFLPDGGATSWMYLLYTVSPQPGVDGPWNLDDEFSFSRLTRWRVVTLQGDVLADPGSRHVLLGNQLADGTVPDGLCCPYEAHSTGSLAFADDGSLLVSQGDGAHVFLHSTNSPDFGGNDPGGFADFVHPVTGKLGPMSVDQDSGAFRAQDLRSLAGKLLRVDPETGAGYPSNPFFDGDASSHASRVWALGLRNPFRFALRPGTGASDPAEGRPNTVYVGDVGWSTWECVYVSKGGENYGWPCVEGTQQLPEFQAWMYEPNPLGFPDCRSVNPGAPTEPLVAVHQFDPGLLEPLGLYVGPGGAPQPTGFVGQSSVAGDFYLAGDYPAQYERLFFFADYSGNWLRTLEVDADDQLVAIRDFGAKLPSIVDVERHPVTGDLYLVSIADESPIGQLVRLRFGTNLTPVAVAQASVTSGEAPLAVAFDGSASSDPDGGALTYAWEFDDGGPGSDVAAPVHVFTRDGQYDVTLTVTDPGGLSSTDVVVVSVGNSPPRVLLTQPAFGSTFVAPTTLVMSAVAGDLEDAQLDWEWRVDQYHDDHVHPGVGSSTAAGSFAYLVEAHGEDGELVYYRIGVTVTDGGGLSASDHVFVYPEEKLRDLTGTMPAFAATDLLVPATPLGDGNTDKEVLRDGVFPPAGTVDALLQFDTFHGGDQGDEDWLGFELPSAPSPESRFVGLTFQAGVHAADGGWFDALDVEVRVDGAWFGVSGLRVEPAYPDAPGTLPGFGVHELRFDPAYGEAVRLVGDPGGASGYVSAAELRVWAVQEETGSEPGLRDVTDEGEVIAKLFELDPPVPTGTGSQVPETIQNGTFPPLGSRSDWAQFDTWHDGDQGDDDWIGYRFPTTRLLTRLVYQEGKNPPTGGWFDDLAVEVRAKGESEWTAVTGLRSTPAYPGTTGPAGWYETFQLDFEPVAVREVRLAGDPAGTVGYVSVAELRALAAVPLADCGWTVHGEGELVNDRLRLSAWQFPSLGSEVVLEVVGADGAGLAWLAAGLPSSGLEVGAWTLWLEPETAVFVASALALDGDGEADLPLVLPADASLLGAELGWQAFGVELAATDTLLASNGLTLTFCP